MEKTKIHQHLSETALVGEKLSARKMRFCLDAKITLPTLHKVLRLLPVSRLVALRVAEATAWAVHPGDLVFPQMKTEIKNDQQETRPNAARVL